MQRDCGGEVKQAEQPMMYSTSTPCLWEGKGESEPLAIDSLSCDVALPPPKIKFKFIPRKIVFRTQRHDEKSPFHSRIHPSSLRG